MHTMIEELGSLIEGKLNVSKGDILELTVMRVPIYASSGAGAQRETRKRVEVYGVKEGHITVLAMGRGLGGHRTMLRLNLDKDGEPSEMTSQKAKYEVSDAKVVKRA